MNNNMETLDWGVSVTTELQLHYFYCTSALVHQSVKLLPVTSLIDIDL